MPAPFFQFKQFTVYHDRCAMKVGTDGVLLGAWADCSDAGRILDVGTGSGLIALMLAQRSGAYIDALDIEENAFSQAKSNFQKSPFAHLLTPFHADFLHYQTNVKYDLIVSNPPYFTHSLLSTDQSRNIARHTGHLTLAAFIQTAHTLLSSSGKIALILPATLYDEIQSVALVNGLHLTKKYLVCPVKNKPPKRILVEYAQRESPTLENILYIEESRHIYSQTFIELVRDFYLYL